MSRSRRAFSLIEMLVVIGILIMLLAILMPVVGNAWDSANGTLCESHIRSLTQAFISFAADHDGHLPGSRENLGSWGGHAPDPNPDHGDWLFGPWAYEADQMAGSFSPTSDQLIQQSLTAPQYGTIWNYVNNNTYAATNLPGGGSYATYRCPSLTISKPGSGVGSNGRFDYAAFSAWDGAALKDIKPFCTLHWPYDAAPLVPGINLYPNALNNNNGWQASPKFWSSYFVTMPTPIICQEDAMYFINSNLEGSHGGPDEMSHIHRGGSYYGSADGSATWVNEPDNDLNLFWTNGAGLWEVIAPSGVSKQLSRTPDTYNDWAHQ